MNSHPAELPAPAMSETAFQRRREHLLAELERPAPGRIRPVVIAVAVVALAVLTFAPISGASLAHRVATGLGDIWSSPAPPPKNPAEVQGFAEDFGPPPGVPNHMGLPLNGEARDLLAGLGIAGDTITAFPTTSGEVCYMIMGAGSCGNLETWPWNTVGFTFSILSTRGTGLRVFGVAADKVASVSIVIAGIRYAATLKNNAFYYQLPAGVSDSDIQQIVAIWTDGSSHPVPVNTHWNPPRG